MGGTVTLQNGHTVDVGCWFYGARGWRISADVVRLAWAYGIEHNSVDEAVLDAFEWMGAVEPTVRSKVRLSR